MGRDIALQRRGLPMLSCAGLIVWALPVFADTFGFPVNCNLGTNCYIQNYFDHDPSENTRDFRCHHLTYDGHDGTDIRVLNLQAMQAGVDVVAALDGVVRATRDGMDDILFSDEQAHTIKDRECGNGVVIDHPDGWQTQYCHMKKGSVLVRSGQPVATGQALGQIGLSGLTQFPHLHFEIRHRKISIDPFAPSGVAQCDGADQDGLWDSNVPYIDSAIMQSGFAGAIPAFDAIKAGMPDLTVVPADFPALVVWTYAFGKRPQDSVHLSIRGPDGFEHDRRWEFDTHQAEYFLAAGRRAPDDGFAAGTYTGQVTLIRNGRVIDTSEQTIEVRQDG